MHTEWFKDSMIFSSSVQKNSFQSFSQTSKVKVLSMDPLAKKWDEEIGVCLKSVSWKYYGPTANWRWPDRWENSGNAPSYPKTFWLNPRCFSKDMRPLVKESKQQWSYKTSRYPASKSISHPHGLHFSKFTPLHLSICCTKELYPARHFLPMKVFKDYWLTFAKIYRQNWCFFSARQIIVWNLGVKALFWPLPSFST